MKALRALLSAAILAGTLLAVGAVAPVAATGNCTTGWVKFWSGLNESGTYVKYCYAVQDLDMESEPGNVLGPLASGAYVNDFADGGGGANDWASGISSWRVSTGTYKVCLYWDKNFDGFWTSVLPGWGFNAALIFNDQLGSFRWSAKNVNCPGE